MTAATPWKDILARERQFCALCDRDGAQVRLGGPEILPPGTDIDTFGRRRYWAALREALEEHLADAHGDWGGRIA